MRKKSFISTGIPTIFMVFAVLCLVVLALMSWGTSRNDLTSARLSLTHSEKYYEACSLGTDLLEQIRQEAALLPTDDTDGFRAEKPDSSDESHPEGLDVPEKIRPEELLQAVQDTVNPVSEGTYPVLEEIRWDNSTDLGQIRIRFGQRQSLQIDFSLSQKEPYYSISGWYTVSSGEWNPDQSQNLFLPESTEFQVPEA